MTRSILRSKSTLLILSAVAAVSLTRLFLFLSPEGGGTSIIGVHIHHLLIGVPAEPDKPRREVAESSGFSLHAGIAAKASQRDKLEHLALLFPVLFVPLI